MSSSAAQEDSEPPAQQQSEQWLEDWISQKPTTHRQLVSTSQPQSILFGTGLEILTSASDVILNSVENEVIFVTCFWAKSASLLNICNLLENLSKKGLSRGLKIRVRISISSVSLTQKLFHTRSPQGRLYEPDEWEKKLWIPASLDLSGLDLRIKSVFITPLSVFHSKFIIIDNKACLVPSCNVSWEDWLEGCMDLRGDVVSLFRKYWQETWNIDTPAAIPAPSTSPNNTSTSIQSLPGATHLPSKDQPPKTTILLPSTYHANPRFRPFPCQSPPPCPQTPLNTFTLQLLTSATSEILLQTPNLTSPAVLTALASALTRGVNVHITTNACLMRNEQLVTAGTTTPQCITRLISTYEAQRTQRNPHATYHTRPGNLRIDYFEPAASRATMTQERRATPVSSHVKMTVVDGRVVLCGSGNMDRASWFTSQEVGVAVVDVGVAGVVRRALVERDEGATVSRYRSPGW